MKTTSPFELDEAEPISTALLPDPPVILRKLPAIVRPASERPQRHHMLPLRNPPYNPKPPGWRAPATRGCVNPQALAPGFEYLGNVRDGDHDADHAMPPLLGEQVIVPVVEHPKAEAHHAPPKGKGKRKKEDEK